MTEDDQLDMANRDRDLFAAIDAWLTWLIRLGLSMPLLIALAMFLKYKMIEVEYVVKIVDLPIEYNDAMKKSDKLCVDGMVC